METNEQGLYTAWQVLESGRFIACLCVLWIEIYVL